MVPRVRAWLTRWRDSCGQDLIEYALLAGFVAIAAGATVPGVTRELDTVIARVTLVLTRAVSTESPGRSPAPSPVPF
jgi:Flp pilus assembly pilin Flp